MADPTDLGEKALNAARSHMIRRGQAVAKRETRILKLQPRSPASDRSGSSSSGNGHKVYDLFQRDLVKNQELRMTCQQIRGVEAEIEMRREEIEQLRRPDTRDEAGVDDTGVETEIVEDERLDDI